MTQKKREQSIEPVIEVKSQKQVKVSERPKYQQTQSLFRYFFRRQLDIIYLKLNNDKLQSGTGVQIGGVVQKVLPPVYASIFFEISSEEKIKQKILTQMSEYKTKPSSSSYKDISSAIVCRQPSLPGVQFKPFAQPFRSFTTNSFLNQDGVSFSSNFQSGNLFAVFKKQPFFYELVLNNDINSRGNTQWFYFAMKFSEKIKSDSLFDHGMKVVVLSQRGYSLSRTQWMKVGSRIKYKQTTISRETPNQNRNYYYLDFQYCPQYEDDVVLFANSYPYSYTQLQNLINDKLNSKKQRFNRVHICKTIAGLSVFAIKLGQAGQARHSLDTQYRMKKKSIVFLGRQHSGETPSSYLVQGVIQALLDTKNYEQLKKQFVIVIVPMVNPDGVFYGNYRSNMSGCDLNRKWRQPNKKYHPEIYYLRRFLAQTNRINPISLIIDFHGHSRKLSSFFYGNPGNDYNFMQNSRVLPLLCSKRNKRISFGDSTFFISEDKKNTARVVLQQMFPSALVYTFQASFCGWRRNRITEGSSFNAASSLQQFTIDDYKKIGQDILHSYSQYLGLKTAPAQLKQKILKQINSRAKAHPQQDHGSDSQPQPQPILEQIVNGNKSPQQQQAIFRQQFPSPTSYIDENKTSYKQLSRPLIRKSHKLTEKKQKIYVDAEVQTDFDPSILTESDIFGNKHSVSRKSTLKQSINCLSLFKQLPNTPNQSSKISSSHMRPNQHTLKMVQNIPTARKSHLDYEAELIKVKVPYHHIKSNTLNSMSHSPSLKRLSVAKNVNVVKPEAESKTKSQKGAQFNSLSVMIGRQLIPNH